MKDLIKKILIKRRIEKAWRKRMEEYDRVKMLVYASKSERYKEDALQLATIYAFRHGTAERKKWCHLQP